MHVTFKLSYPLSQELVEARKVKAKQNVDEAASKEETGDQKEERAGAEEKPRYDCRYTFFIV